MVWTLTSQVSKTNWQSNFDNQAGEDDDVDWIAPLRAVCRSGICMDVAYQIHQSYMARVGRGVFAPYRTSDFTCVIRQLGAWLVPPDWVDNRSLSTQRAPPVTTQRTIMS